MPSNGKPADDGLVVDALQKIDSSLGDKLSKSEASSAYQTQAGLDAAIAAAASSEASQARAILDTIYNKGAHYLSASAGGVDPETGQILRGVSVGGSTAQDAQLAALLAVAKKRRAHLVFDQPGYVVLNNPLVLDYSASGSLNELVPGLVGTGYQTGIKSRVATWGRGALEVIGSSNILSANSLVENFRVLVEPGSDSSSLAAQQGVYVLRVGDAKNFFTAKRLWLDGPNGISFKVAGSSSYAHLNSRFEQVAIQSNYSGAWWNDTNDPAVNNCSAYAVSCLAPDWGGALPDTVTFDQCSISGLMEAKAFVLNVRGGDFSTNPNRPQVGGIDFGSNILYQGGGVLNVDGAYFEDHQYGVRVTNGVTTVPVVNIEKSFFTGQQNYTGANSRRSQRAIYATAFYGSPSYTDQLNVRGNVFGYGGPGASTGYANKPVLTEFVQSVNHSGNAVSGQYPRQAEADLFEAVS